MMDVDKRLKVLKKESKNPNLDKEVKNDISHYQWATSNRDHHINFKTLKEKYTKQENVSKYNKSEKDASDNNVTTIYVMIAGILTINKGNSDSCCLRKCG